MTVQEPFRALVARRQEKGHAVEPTGLKMADLPPGNVTIRVTHSSLNYKDGLALQGRPGILKTFPIVPGIDLAGEVVDGSGEGFGPGDQVVVTGWGIGENTSGGYAEYARVQSEWVEPLPAGTDSAWAMAVGTAGFTAMLAVLALERHTFYGADLGGPILVTGATGGVGSTAVALLAAAGHEVHASTGKLDQADYLRELGAAEVLPREEISELNRPLESERWAAAIDTVGGSTLAGIMAATRRQGAVAVCGLAGSAELTATVFPLILRGVSLLGIDSVACPRPLRREAWARLARDLPIERLAPMTQTYTLDDLPGLSRRILAGELRGRSVIRVAPD
ncbi:MDR family oxidoreductase [Deinococcus radiophilus]|uniref:Oxidoreductase n=1 Tax=Deinococcus radiophilus TaxID=32062 RepID=A0A3S0KJV2_9DEIO|nr:MDR family oxidoreductase [Deinococcus radiophilus]RTR28314.1 oxidoreductase [Deinococcus radiophilus]UFA51177.1 oxidoreductase [Deinococcus radiophilus]